MYPKNGPLQLALQFGAVLLCSTVGCVLASVIHSAIRMPEFNLRFLSLGTSKTNIMFSFFTGLPAGTILGLVIAVCVLGRGRFSMVALGGALVLMCVGLLAGSVSLDVIGGWTMYLFPVIVSGCGCLGYVLGLQLAHR